MESKRFDPKNAGKLLSEERRANIQPEKLIEHLNVRPDDIVADLGAGPGLFTIPVAKQTNRAVYAVDVEQDMLDLLKQHAESENLDNIQLLLNDLEHIQLADHSVTRVINTFVIHEVADVNNAIDEMNRILKPGGYVLLADWEAVASESGPPLDIRIPSEKINRLLQEKGFHTEWVQMRSEHYGIVAVKGEK